MLIDGKTKILAPRTKETRIVGVKTSMTYQRFNIQVFCLWGGEGEPPEISRIKKELNRLSQDFKDTGDWLSKAMESSWDVAKKLVKNPQLSDVLGERHRIIINDWEAAQLSLLISKLINRAVTLLEIIDFTPTAIRHDIKAVKTFPDYLYSASELIDRAADMASTSAMLVHDNKKRWRVFREKIQKTKKLDFRRR